MLDRIDPGLAIEPGTVDHQRVAIPRADRVSHPGWLQVLGMLASIGRDDVKNIVGFEQQRDALGSLHDLHRIFYLPGARVTPRQAVPGVIETVFIFPLGEPCFGERQSSRALLYAPLRLRSTALAIFGDVGYARMIPDAVEIRLAVRHAGNILGRSGLRVYGSDPKQCSQRATGNQ